MTGFVCVALLLYFITTVDAQLLSKTEYDYIIVGAGSAGATIANRLSEDPSFQVLLLEAGDEPPNYSDVPFLPSLIQETDYDWNYLSEPQENGAFGFDKHKIPIPRGKVLGGSSILNYMIYARGNAKDFDIWEEQGCSGWGYKDVLPYFIKSEDCRISGIANNGYHGVGGELTVSSPGHKTFYQQTVFKTLESMGYKEVDYNGANQTGYSKSQYTIRDGKRCSTEKAFLRPAMGRPNLKIISSAFVTKIEFDENKRAKFVIFEKDKFTHKVEANSEIIVSGGTFNSPQLLMLSGIGPKEHLQQLGIPMVADLPSVGQNFHDHLMILGAISPVNVTLDFSEALWNYEKLVETFKLQSTGPLTVPGGVETVAFVNTKYSPKSQDFPDIELVFLGVPHFLPFKPLSDELRSRFEPHLHTNAITIFPILQRPKSRGYIKLRSADPYDQPIIDPHYLKEDEDVNVLADGKYCFYNFQITRVNGLRIVKEIVDSKPFQEVGAEFLLDSLPGCEEHQSWSEEYRKCVVRVLIGTVYHPVGSCKMGAENDPTAVVDPQLRVKGVKGLRVADASVMPNVVSANTNAASIMIGEKAADLIKMAALE